ncbi:zinc exporter, putative [Ixodes scapularis]|uniref:Zinc exporter, putative n=1 Tax=Ixodes scapularis TaxID=6945 RepID=B7Q6V2_IXOSC|nr:zinc exporter, putative [Ixodes scapularis]|eukprot:XP_002403421.1 zinc exporter, putative [Ixodes scapularis]
MPFRRFQGGVLLLVLTLCLQTGFRTLSRTLAVDIGGAKRLNALSSVISMVALAPLALVLQFSTSAGKDHVSAVPFLPPMAFSGIVLFVLDYYVESVCQARLGPQASAKLGSLTVFSAALALALAWRGRALGLPNYWGSPTPEQHLLSGGLVFAWLMFVLD